MSAPTEYEYIECQPSNAEGDVYVPVDDAPKEVDWGSLFKNPAWIVLFSVLAVVAAAQVGIWFYKRGRGGAP
jgi:hypothetical protein